MANSETLLKLRNQLLNVAIESAKVPAGQYILIERKKSPELLALRPTLHISQIGIYGVAKSETNNRIEKYCLENKIPFYDTSGATYPSLVGSITDKGYIIPPLNLDYVGGVVSIDELKTGHNPNERSETLGSFLSLLSHERTTRNLARKPKESSRKALEEKCKKLSVKVEVISGKISFRNMRNAWIFSTAKKLQKSRGREMFMLISRTMPIWWFPTIEEQKSFDDNPELLFKGLNLEAPDLTKPILNEEYLKIRDFVEGNFKVQMLTDDKKYLDHLFLRTTNNLVRAYVFLGDHNKNLYNYMINNTTAFVEKIDRTFTEQIRDEIMYNM